MSNKPGRKADPELLKQVEHFKALKVGDSFFVEGKTAAEMEYLRRPVIRAGVGITIRNIECDVVHKTKGVRVWRLSGPHDSEL